MANPIATLIGETKVSKPAVKVGKKKGKQKSKQKGKQYRG